MRNRWVFAGACLGLVCCCCVAEDALFDGTFERGGIAPDGWKAAGDGVVCEWLTVGGHTGDRAVAAKSRAERDAWVSVRLPLAAAAKCVVDAWIKTERGAAWLEVRGYDGDSRIVSRSTSPAVKSAKDWTYTAVDFPAAPDAARTIEIVFVVKGKAALDDVQVRTPPGLDVLNPGFEAPLDAKGRVLFWSPDPAQDLLPGKGEGEFVLDTQDPPEGKAALRLTAKGDWFACSPVHSPVWEWTKEVTVASIARAEGAASVQVGVVWTDAAQKVLRVDWGAGAGASAWQRIGAGPFAPPEGARQMRPVAVVRKNDAASSAAAGCFDAVAVYANDAPFVRICVNQVGYEARGPKTAVVLTNFFPAEKRAGTFDLVDARGRKVVNGRLECLGRMSGAKDADWGWYFWRADFSACTKPGTYRIRAKTGGIPAESYPFQIGQDLLFRETAQANADFFYVQRCGFEVPGWHAPCHLDDAKMPDGTHRDLTGGWHSAGDYNKLNYEYGDGGAMYALIGAYDALPANFESIDRDRDGLCDIVDEAWWGARFLAKVQMPETGGIVNHIEQGPDRKTWMNWCPPEKTTDNIAGTADDPIVTKGEGNSPLAIAGWVRLARVLKGRGIDTDYVERAVRLWEHATAGGADTGSPLLLIGALDLHQATADGRFLEYARRSAETLLAGVAPNGQLTGGYGNSGDIPAAALAAFALCYPGDPLTPLIKQRLEAHTPGFLAEAENPLGLMMQQSGADGYFFEPTSTLGCNYQISCRAWSALNVYRVTRDRRLLEYATAQLDFILGKNPYGLCMMEGKGTLNLPRYHHRYGTIPGHEGGAVPGAIPNGFVRDIASNDRPGVDLSTGGRPYPSYRTNEPWLIHNVFYTLAITALHEAYQGE